jgi:hypothetical protein
MTGRPGPGPPLPPGLLTATTRESPGSGMVRDPPDRARRRKPGRARPCGGPGPSPSHGPIRRPPAAAGAATYGGSAPRAALATEGARLERAPASLAGARRTGSVTRPGRLSGPGLRGPGRLGASGVEVPDWQRRGWRAASGGGRHGGRAPGSDRGAAGPSRQVRVTVQVHGSRWPGGATGGRPPGTTAGSAGPATRGE